MYEPAAGRAQGLPDDPHSFVPSCLYSTSIELPGVWMVYVPAADALSVRQATPDVGAAAPNGCGSTTGQPTGSDRRLIWRS